MPSFRDASKTRTRNLEFVLQSEIYVEIPGLVLRTIPE